MPVDTHSPRFAARLESLAPWLKLLFHPYALFTYVVLAVWLPGGFDIGPFQKEDIELFNAHLGAWAILDSMMTRPFRDIPIWLGLRLTPHSFAGWQLMMLLLAVLRAGLIYEIVRRVVPGLPLFALACGLLAAFNPADSGYFWLNTTGAQFSLVLALASCLLAIMHLDKPEFRTLAGMWAFQLLSGFTYPGYLLWMVAIPAGAWLYRRLQGSKPALLFLVKIAAIACALACALVLVEALLMKTVSREDARVTDVNPHRIMAGYAWALRRTASSPYDLVARLDGAYLLPALLAAAATLLGAFLLLTDRRSTKGASTRFTWILAGCVLFALLSYLPYSITIERFSDRRQLYGLGVFGLGACCLVLFMLSSRLGHGKLLPVLIVALIASVAVFSGLEKRAYLIYRYRTVEDLLSGIALTVPRPPEGALILVHLSDPCSMKDVAGIYRHPDRFSMLLSFMYGQATQGLIAGLKQNPASLDCRRDPREPPGALGTIDAQADAPAADDRSWQRPTPPVHDLAPGALISLDYSPAGGVRLLDASGFASMRATAVVPDGLSYTPPDIGAAPAPSANICVMLEPASRPSYCAVLH